MDIRTGFEMLTGYIRSFKKRLLTITIISTLISVSVFAGGSYFFLYRYYQKIIKEYYTGLTKEIYFLQEKLIKKDLYIEDIKVVCESLVERNGVLQAWCTDRFGRLIFHTDPGVLAEYRSKRLPAAYYSSIDRLWVFNQGYPENYIEKSGFLKRRITTPLYPFNKDNHDFIIGMEVKWLIFLTERISYLFLFAGGYILLAIAILFLPVYFWAGGSFSDITTQTRVLAGKLQLESERKTMEVVEQEPAEGEEKVIEEETYEEEEAEKEEVEEKEKEAVEEVVSVKNTRGTGELLLLMDKKNILFHRKELTLPFVHAVSFVFHSKSPQGSYLLYLNRGKKHIFTSFNNPDEGVLSTTKYLDKIVQDITGELEVEDTGKGIMRSLNNRYSSEGGKLDISCVFLEEEEKKAEFVSCGTGYAIYLKYGEDVVKDLKINNPQLGEVSDEDFEKNCVYAELKLSNGDIFILLPHNADTFQANKERLLDICKKQIINKGTLGALEIGREIQKEIEEIRKKNRQLPETGFALFKFV